MAESELPTVSIPGTSTATTVLGYGCSNLLGDKTRAQGLTLLHSAYDAGVRHFDVARYYGFGEAEGLVGELARGRRADITIATKFGLQPQSGLARASGLIRGIRRLMQASPRIRRLVRRNVHSFVQSGRFDVPSARKSLETSLRELGTDYIDILLLHEGKAGDCTLELLAFLDEARAEGKIIAFGVASAAEDVAGICEQAPAFSGVVQFPSSLLLPASVPAVDPRLPAGRRFVVHHGAFSIATALSAALRDSPAAANRLRAILDSDLPADELLSAIVVRGARRANGAGPVVFSSTSPARIRLNARFGSQEPLSDLQLEAVLDLLAGRHSRGGDE